MSKRDSVQPQEPADKNPISDTLVVASDALDTSGALVTPSAAETPTADCATAVLAPESNPDPILTPAPTLTTTPTPPTLSAAKSRSTHHQQPTPIAMPQALEAERSVLGGLLVDNSAWDQVAAILQPEDFYLPSHRAIFLVLIALSRRGQPFDIVTLSELLKERGEMELAGGEAYLFELAQTVPVLANIRAYAELVHNRAIQRKLIKLAQELAEQAFNLREITVAQLLGNVEQQIFQLADHHRLIRSGPVAITNLLTAASERIDELYHSNSNITGLSTGFIDLDELTSGLQEGDLVIVAGRPSMGKTSFAMNIVESATLRSHLPVLVFSMEMSGEALAMRMISSLGRIDQRRVRTGKLTDDDWPRLGSAVGMLSEANLFIDETPALSPTDILSRARRILKSQKQLGLIVIDYLQLMAIPGFREGRVAEITEISRGLKSLAKELKVPVIALSQLNRGLEQRMDKRPQMSDLRESGAIEQDADLILFIYRDEVYREDTPDKGIAEIIIAKQRNGPIGKIKLTFLGQYTRFENYVDNEHGINC